MWNMHVICSSHWNAQINMTRNSERVREWEKLDQKKAIQIQATTVQLTFKCILFATMKSNADFIRFILHLFSSFSRHHEGNWEKQHQQRVVCMYMYTCMTIMRWKEFFLCLQITFTFCDKTRWVFAWTSAIECVQLDTNCLLENLIFHQEFMRFASI